MNIDANKLREAIKCLTKNVSIMVDNIEIQMQVVELEMLTSITKLRKKLDSYENNVNIFETAMQNRPNDVLRQEKLNAAKEKLAVYKTRLRGQEEDLAECITKRVLQEQMKPNRP